MYVDIIINGKLYSADIIKTKNKLYLYNFRYKIRKLSNEKIKRLIKYKASIYINAKQLRNNRLDFNKKGVLYIVPLSSAKMGFSSKDRKRSMSCNKPIKSWKKGKKKVVKACVGSKEKLIHFGASGYGHNYSPAARKSFRARHKCNTAKDKLTARYWACKNLWTKGGESKRCPKNKKCKRKSR